MISIITVTYNSAKTIKDTLESILAQDYQDYECIIVDGLSTDGTIDIIRGYEARFEGRLKWISEKDDGLYDAMNKGIGMAGGDIVGILNSDDFYTSCDILSTIFEAFSHDTALDAVYGDVHYIHGEKMNDCVRYYSSKKYSRLSIKVGVMPAHPSFYCKKSCYEKFGYFDTSYKIAADFENLLRMIYLGGIKTQYIQKDFVTMRLGGVSTRGIKSHIKVMKEHFHAYRKNNIKINPFLYFSRYPIKLLEYIIK